MGKREFMSSAAISLHIEGDSWVRWWGTLTATTRRSLVMHATITESDLFDRNQAADSI
jgi:hypothetical protein